MAMAEATPFTIGAGASCADGVCGEVSRVVVDPVARSVTHLVVEPKGRRGLGRLVPLDLVDATGGQIRLRCTVAEFESLEPAEETQFAPGTQGYKDVAIPISAVTSVDDGIRLHITKQQVQDLPQVDIDHPRG